MVYWRSNFQDYLSMGYRPGERLKGDQIVEQNGRKVSWLHMSAGWDFCTDTVYYGLIRNYKYLLKVVDVWN